jgi:hypothetical protein
LDWLQSIDNIIIDSEVLYLFKKFVKRSNEINLSRLDLMEFTNKSKWSFLKAVTMWLNWLTEHIRLIKGHCPPDFIDKIVKRGCGCGRNRLPATIVLNTIFLKQTIPILSLEVHILSQSNSKMVWNYVLINVQRGLWQRENKFDSVSKTWTDSF